MTNKIDLKDLLDSLISTFEQQEKIDIKKYIKNIDAEIKKAYSSADKVMLWQDFADALNYLGLSKDAVSYLECAADEVKKIEDPKEQADAYLRLHTSAKAVQNNSLASKVLEMAVKETDKIENLEEKVSRYDRLYTEFKEEAKYDKRKEMIHKATSAIIAHPDVNEKIDQFYSCGMDLARNEEFGDLLAFAQKFADCLDVEIKYSNEIADYICNLGTIASEMCEKSPIGGRYAPQVVQTGMTVLDRVPEEWICVSELRFMPETLWKDKFTLDLADSFVYAGEISRALELFNSIPVKRWYKFASPRNRYNRDAGDIEINLAGLLRLFADRGFIEVALSQAKKISSKNLLADVYEEVMSKYAEQGDIANAEALFQKAMSLKSSHKDGVLQKYIHSMAKADPKKVLERFNQIESAFVQSIVADDVCEALAKNKMYDDAIRTVEKITDLGTMEEANIETKENKKNSAYAAIARAAIENSDFNVAEKLANEKITNFKEWPAKYVAQSLAIKYAKENKPEAAKKMLQKLEGDALEEARIELSRHYINENNVQKAEEYIKGISKAKLSLVVNTFLEKGMLSKAKEYMEEITDKNTYIRALITFLSHAKNE